MKQKRAFFISFEGIEGTGKSTHAQLLSRYLKRKGLSIVFFREPGSSEVGERIREILLHGKEKLTGFSEALLFLAARAQLVEEKIKPALGKKNVVILDRYIDATLAYQGYGAGVDFNLIKKLNNFAVGDVVPDLTILLDVPAKLGLQRSGRKDRFEKRKISFHKKVREGYLKIAKENPKRIKVISAKNSIQVVQEAIRRMAEKAL